jgi:hypothetical protein
MAPEAPTADELHMNSVVQAALEAAWNDSLADDPMLRHEEGGWIYWDSADEDVSVIRARAGQTSEIELDDPPEIDGSFVIGKFHTHPNPSSEGWDPRPSRGDRIVDAIHGVPDLIRSDDGIHHSGPERRRGGLIGTPRLSFLGAIA